MGVRKSVSDTHLPAAGKSIDDRIQAILVFFLYMNFMTTILSFIGVYIPSRVIVNLSLPFQCIFNGMDVHLYFDVGAHHQGFSPFGFFSPLVLFLVAVSVF